MERELNEQRRLAGLPVVDEAVRVGGIEKAKAPTHDALVAFSKKPVQAAKDIQTSIAGLAATTSALAKMVDLYWQKNPSVYDSSYNQVANLLKDTNKKLETLRQEIGEVGNTLYDVGMTLLRDPDFKPSKE